MEGFIIISITGDGGGGVSGCLVCIVVDGGICLLRIELIERGTEDALDVDG